MSDNKKVETTGHVWDEDLKEFNNPLPRWWLIVMYITIIWGIGYTIWYPAWPLVERATQGISGYKIRAAVEEDIARFDAMNADLEAELATADLTTVEPGTPLYNYAIQSGNATFNTYCSQCHGSGAQGAPGGYPSLLDNDWLWGGDIEAITYTITHGVRAEEDFDTRYSEMPAFGDDWLEDEEIDNVTHYAMSLGGLDHDAAKAEAGAVVFADNCASCHMEDGTGDREQGAPDLTDAIWLYGSDYDTIRHNIETGPFGVMPAWGMNENFDAAKIAAVALYVHSRGGGE